MYPKAYPEQAKSFEINLKVELETRLKTELKMFLNRDLMTRETPRTLPFWMLTIGNFKARRFLFGLCKFSRLQFFLSRCRMQQQKSLSFVTFPIQNVLKFRNYHGIIKIESVPEFPLLNFFAIKV